MDQKNAKNINNYGNLKLIFEKYSAMYHTKWLALNDAEYECEQCGLVVRMPLLPMKCPSCKRYTK